MKRKCSNCDVEFEFKAKDLEISESQKRSYHSSLKYGYGIYYVKCPFCLTPKRVLYNHKPRHIKVGSE